MAKRSGQPKNTEAAAAQQQARETIAAKLREWSGFALAGGMATLTAAGALALATGQHETALGVATVGLGANWFSALVSDLRQKAAAKHDPRTLIAEAAKATEANLTDARLAQLIERFDLITAALGALKDNQSQRDALVQELLARKLATPEQIRQSANSVSVSIADSVFDSAVITIGGDNHGDIHIDLGGDRVNLAPQIKTYRRSLAARVSVLDLLAVNSQSLDDPDRISLADVYTPLHASASPTGAKSAADMDMRDPDAARRERDATRLIPLLSEHPRTVILGDPGCGKSTVLSYLALGLCGLLDSSQDFAAQWSHGSLLPLRVVLREFARSPRAADKENGLLRFAQDQLHTPETARLAEGLSDYLQTHGAIWLLDGLDEVPAGQRRDVKAQIERLVQVYPNCRFVVTCRGYSYESPATQLRPQTPYALPFETLTVRALEPEDMRVFVRGYFAQLGLKGRTTTAELHTRELTTALDERPNLQRMGANPLLLSLMVLVHLDRGRLPNNRVELLKEVVDSLLSKWKKEIYQGEAHPDQLHDFRIRQAIEKRNESFKQKLYEIALDAHIAMRQPEHARDDDESDQDHVADIPREQLEAALGAFFKPELQEGLFNLESVWTYLSNRVGLLNYAGGDDAGDAAGGAGRKHTYKFPHRLIQEYLAAKAIDELGRREELNLPARLDADLARWREVTALVALMNNLSHTRECVDELCECSADDPPVTQGQARRAALAGQIWLDREISDAQFENAKLRAHYERIRRLQVVLLGQTELLTARERAAVGRTLACLRGGDPRPEATTLKGMCDAMVTIPAGAFQMGSSDLDEMAWDAEMPLHTQRIQSAYRIARFPVTNAQYHAFVAAGGYDDLCWWAHAGESRRHGHGYRQWDGEAYEKVQHWYRDSFGLDTHPVVGVSWDEAVAFTLWLTDLARKERWIAPHEQLRLPSEAEWERACRGDQDARVTPWNGPTDPQRSNYDDSGIGATSAVGCFPNGATAEGCEDMIGNVWEWTLSKWTNNYDNYAEAEDNTVDTSGRARVLRGGSWDDDLQFARAAARYHLFDPPERFSYFGFRVVCAPVPRPSGI